MTDSQYVLTPEEITAVEKELLDEMLTCIMNDRITPDDAQSLAKEFLSLLPFQDKKDLLHKLQILAEKYPAAQPVYVDVAIPLEKAEKEKKLQEIAKVLKTGDIESAIAIAKKENL